MTEKFLIGVAGLLVLALILLMFLMAGYLLSKGGKGVNEAEIETIQGLAQHCDLNTQVELNRRLREILEWVIKLNTEAS